MKKPKNARPAKDKQSITPAQLPPPEPQPSLAPPSLSPPEPQPDSTSSALSLAKLDAMTPEEFQGALGIKLKQMLVEGLETIPAPSSIKDLSTLANLIRKIDRLDEVTKDSNPGNLVIPVRSIRRGPIIELEDDPTEGII